MRSKVKIIISLLIIILFITIQSSNVISDLHSRVVIEPVLTDTLDGNWTALWSLDNPDNYTLKNIEIIDGKAKLEFNRLSFVEDTLTEFNNGTWENITGYGSNSLAIDLQNLLSNLIADTGNNRVIETLGDDWYWQYGSNTTSGFGLNELDAPSFAVQLPGDRILITDTNNHRVIEVGLNSEFYWQYGLNGTAGTGNDNLTSPSSAMPMANGNILITDTGNNYVVEVNRSKKIVWKYDIGLNVPKYAEELANGSILISDKNNHRVLEVNKNKQIYWNYGSGVAGSGINQLFEPDFGTRLDDGNTLIADTTNNRVIEVNNAKINLWQYGKGKNQPGYVYDRLEGPSCAVRLPNGNTLITDSDNHRVVEVKNDKTWVWQYGINGSGGVDSNYLDNPTSGFRLEKTELKGTFTSQVLDGGDVTNWTNISWMHTTPQDTEIRLYTRTGDKSTPDTGIWSPWSAAYSNSAGENITSPMNRYIQYRAILITQDLGVSPILISITINGTGYEKIGELVTDYFEPSGLLGWVKLTWNGQYYGEQIQPHYTTKDIPKWNKVGVDGDLTIAPIDTGKISFKFELSTSNITISPVLNDFTLTFERLGKLHMIEITPDSANVTAGEEFNFTGVGYDLYGREVQIAPTWTTDIGIIDNDNGTLTTLTAQTMPGTGFVNATENGVTGSAVVNVIPGPLDHIMIMPNDVVVIAGESQTFDAIGYDKYNNIVSIEPTWETDVGSMVENQLMAQNFAGSGIVRAMVNPIEGIANVTVELNSSKHHPPKILSKVPDQVKPEDSEPWLLNLASYESDDEDPGEDLHWFLTDFDEAHYTVTGAYSETDVLTFIPKQDGFGTDQATLWLIDSDNMTASQPLWVNITPVNDKPVIKEIPDIYVHFEEPYTFDYSNYIFDIETQDEGLILNVIEPGEQRYTTVNGMEVIYNYPKSMLEETLLLTLVVSDGEAAAQEIFELTISDNHAPELIKQFSDITMFEGDEKDFIFNLDDHFTDKDSDPLTYFVNAEYLSVNIHQNHSVSISANTLWSGTENITFRALDPSGGLAEGNLKVVVVQVNKPPLILPIPDLYIHYDYDYYFDLSVYVTDPDNATSQLQIRTSKMEYIRFNESDNMLMILNFPLELLGQSLVITIHVSDGLEIVMDEFRVYVTDNYPPEQKKKLADISFEEDSILQKALDLSEHFTDMDDTNLTFSYILSDEENITIDIDPNSTVDFSSKQDWFGESSVIFRAEDQSSAFAQSGLRVVVIPVNDAPEIEPIPVQEGKVGDRWILDLTPYIFDVDNNKTDLEIFIDSELVTITGSQLTFYADKSTKTEIELIVTDQYLNTTGYIELIISDVDVSQGQDYFTTVLMLLLIIVLIIVLMSIMVYRRRRGNFTVTDVFLIHEDGILIKYKGATIKGDSDEDLISGMFTAVQSFITDSFAGGSGEDKEKWSLNELKMGESEIMIERGNKIYLAVIYKGRSGQRLQKMISRTMNIIEDNYGSLFIKWDGTNKNMDGLDDIITMLLKSKKPPAEKYSKQYAQSRSQKVQEHGYKPLPKKPQTPKPKPKRLSKQVPKKPALPRHKQFKLNRLLILIQNLHLLQPNHTNRLPNPDKSRAHNLQFPQPNHTNRLSKRFKNRILLIIIK